MTCLASRKNDAGLSRTLFVLLLLSAFLAPAFAAIHKEAAFGPVRGEFRILSDWGEAYHAEVVLRNRSEQIFPAWSVTLGLPSEIRSIWNADVRRTGDGVLQFDAANFSWQRDIGPNGEARFGFIAAPGGLKQAPAIFLISSNSPDAEKSAAPAVASPSPQPTPHGEARTGKPAELPADDVPPPTTVSESAQHPEPTALREVGSFDYSAALRLALMFYDIQRSGHLPKNFRIPWRSDSALNDGADVGADLSGGFYDAGDHMKFALPMLSAMSLLAWGGLEYESGFRAADEWDSCLSILRWGLDWAIRAHIAPEVFAAQIGVPALDHAYWGPPEGMRMPRPTFLITPQAPGSEVAGEAAAAMAAGSMVFRNEDREFSQNLLRHAEQLLRFAENHRRVYTESIPAARGYYDSRTGYLDELAWASAWLFRATGKEEYLEKARNFLRDHLRQGANSDLRWTHSWDDKSYGTLVLLSSLPGGNEWHPLAEKWFSFWTGEGIHAIQRTQGGLAWLDSWGSLRYAANTAFLAFVYADRVGDADGRLRAFAIRQINYILGDNPARKSYLIGFGKDFPRNPHHRAAHASWSNTIYYPAQNRYTLYGGLVGGPTAPDDFAWWDSRADYRGNEVALDYNAGLTGALARLTLAQAMQSSADAPRNLRRERAEPPREAPFYRRWNR